MQLCLDFTLWQTLNTSCIVKSCNQNLTCKVMAAVGFPLFTSLMNFLNSCLENIFWYISNIFNIVYRLFLYLHSLTRRDISSVTWMLLPWIDWNSSDVNAITLFVPWASLPSSEPLLYPWILRNKPKQAWEIKSMKIGWQGNWMLESWNYTLRNTDFLLKQDVLYSRLIWKWHFFVSQLFRCDVIKGGGLFTMLSITFTAVCQPAKTYSCLAAKVALSTRMQYSASLF